MKNLSNDLIAEHLEELTQLEPNGFPFISLYLNTQPNQHGRDNFEPFVRKELAARARTFADGSREREYFERDAGRIVRYLTDNLEPSANGAAIFACTGQEDFFKAMQLDAPIQKHSLHVSERPFIYPLARLIEQNPVYVVLLADTQSARIFVFDLGRVRRLEEFTSADNSFAAVGEHSHMRYRRRVENSQGLHAKEIIEILERVVIEENAERVILAGDEIIITLLRQRMPAQIADKIIDILRLDIRSPEREILRATIESLREDNIQADAEKVRELFDQYRAGGLGVVGLDKTMYALVHGQADELVISASPDALDPLPAEVAAAGTAAVQPAKELSPKTIADALVSLAGKSGARVTFIEDEELLADVGGVGAFLRYKAGVREDTYVFR